MTKADGLEILHTFGEILRADVVVDPRIAGTVSLELKHTPVDQSLDTVCQALSCDWTYTEGRNGKKPVLRMTSRKRSEAGGRGRCAAPAVYPFLRREKKSAIEPKPEPVAVGAEAPLRA